MTTALRSNTTWQLQTQTMPTDDDDDDDDDDDAGNDGWVWALALLSLSCQKHFSHLLAILSELVQWQHLSDGDWGGGALQIAFLEYPPGKLTCPLKSQFWVDDFPFPKVGYVSSLEGTPYKNMAGQVTRVRKTLFFAGIMESWILRFGGWKMLETLFTLVSCNTASNQMQIFMPK